MATKKGRAQAGSGLRSPDEKGPEVKAGSRSRRGSDAKSGAEGTRDADAKQNGTNIKGEDTKEVSENKGDTEAKQDAQSAHPGEIKRDSVPTGGPETRLDSEAKPDAEARQDAETKRDAETRRDDPETKREAGTGQGAEFTPESNTKQTAETGRDSVPILHSVSRYRGDTKAANDSETRRGIETGQTRSIADTADSSPEERRYAEKRDSTRAGDAEEDRTRDEDAESAKKSETGVLQWISGAVARARGIRPSEDRKEGTPDNGKATPRSEGAADRRKSLPPKERPQRPGSKPTGKPQANDGEYYSGSEDYCEEVTEEVIEPDHERDRGHATPVTVRTTRTTTKKRKYDKPRSRPDHPSGYSAKPSTSTEKKNRDGRRKQSTAIDEQSRQDGRDHPDDTSTCPCCGSLWPGHWADSRPANMPRRQSRTWLRRPRRAHEDQGGEEWYQGRFFGRRPSGEFPPGGLPPTHFGAYNARPPFAQYPMGLQTAYQPGLQGLYPFPPMAVGPLPAVPAPSGALFMPPVAAADPYGTHAQQLPGYFCASCCARGAHAGQRSRSGRLASPTMSMDDFLRRELRVRQEERLRLEERALREEKLRREERLLREERRQREERARREDRRRREARELEKARARLEERLRVDERIFEERRLAAEALLEEQKRERLERQRRERLDEQRRYNERLRRAIAEQRSADRGGASLDDLLAVSRLRPAATPSARAISQDAYRAAALRELLLRTPVRPPQTPRVISTDRAVGRSSDLVSERPSRWEDVRPFTQTAGPPSSTGWQARKQLR